MNLSEGFRIGITAIVIITMAMVEAPIITALIGSYCMGRVLSEQLIKG